MNYREQWQIQGYLVVRNAFNPEQIARLLEVCEKSFAQWKENSSEENQPGRYAWGPLAWSMVHLNHPSYYRERPEDLRVLLDAIANPLALEITRDIFQENPLFMQSNYYIDPPGGTKPAIWHRDSQFFTVDDEEKEKQDIFAEADPPRELHMHIPLVSTAASEIVPGSHARWDTPEENDVRRNDPLSDNMPGALRLHLEPGDLAFFHVNTLHRGRYTQGVPRRTIAVTYSRESVTRKATAESFKQWEGYICSYQPWTKAPHYLDGVAEPTNELFQRFIGAYQDNWDPAFLAGVNPQLQSYFKDY